MSYDPNEIADVLDKAHDVLLDRGWCQGRLADGDGRVCTMGAVYMAATGDVLACELGKVAVRVLECVVDRVIPGWNDDFARTEDEVFDLLRNTAKKLRDSQAAPKGTAAAKGRVESGSASRLPAPSSP